MPLRNNSMAIFNNMKLPQRQRGEGKSISSKNINIMAGDTKMQVHRGRSSPNLSAKKGLVTRSASISEAYKDSKRLPLLKSSSAVTVLSKTDKRLNRLDNEVKYYSEPTSQIGSVLDDELDTHLFSSKAYEQILLELNLLPETLSPEKQIINEWVGTPEKSETVLTSAVKGFQAFDGSRFSPIEEAFFVLNSSTTDLCANVVSEKAAETVHPEQDYLVNVYHNPFQAGIFQRTSEESVSDDKCFTCTSEESSAKTSQIDSVLDDELDTHLFTSKAYEQTLLELNLLPETLSPEKHIINEWVGTPEKSETVLTSAVKGFQAFDGSRFSPIEEAFFVLNSSTTDLCANVVSEKAAETVHPEQDYLVNVYHNPFQAGIFQRTSEESVSDDKCFTCTSEESSAKCFTYGSLETSSVLQNAKRLADFEIPGLVGKIEALEEELMEIKERNKKLERLLKILLELNLLPETLSPEKQIINEWDQLQQYLLIRFASEKMSVKLIIKN